MSIATLQTALNQARTLLNDDTAAQFSDAVLIPKAQIAHQELQTSLWDCGSPIIRKVSAGILITAGVLDMTGILPTDLLTPFKLNESANSTGPWVPMTEVYFISDLQSQNPPVTAGATLVWWSWIGDNIAFLGSTNNRYVQLAYRRQITVPSAVGDSLGLPFAEQFLGPRIAALAGGSLGDPNSLTTLSAMADANLAKVITANRGSQMPAKKP